MGNSPQNIALKEPKEQLMLQIDMAAAGVAYEEKYGQPININEIKKNVPVEFHAYFEDKLEHYRKLSPSLGKLDSIED